MYRKGNNAAWDGWPFDVAARRASAEITTSHAFHLHHGVAQCRLMAEDRFQAHSAFPADQTGLDAAAAASAAISATAPPETIFRLMARRGGQCAAWHGCSNRLIDDDMLNRPVEG